MLSTLIESADLIIWDEALISHRKCGDAFLADCGCFNAGEGSFCVALSAIDPALDDVPFGG